MKKEAKEPQQILKKMVSQETKEIIWNIINSLLAGGLVLVGSLADGEISWRGIFVAVCAAGGIAIAQFKKYWESEEGEYKCKKLACLGSFL